MNDPRKVDMFARLALIVVVAAFAAGTSRHILQPYLESQRNIRVFREAVGILSKADGRLEHLDREIQRLESEIAAGETMLPSEINLDAFLDQVGDIAAAEGIRVERLAPTSIRQYRLFRELALEVHVKGPFPSIADFIARLEHGDRMSRVNRLTITPDPDGTDCSAKMNLALYFAPEAGV